MLLLHWQLTIDPRDPCTIETDTTEKFTSKTWGGCGELDHKLGGKKRYLWPMCGFDADRDNTGARNILIRHLSVNMK